MGINSVTLVYYFADKEELIAAKHIATIRDHYVRSPQTYVALCEVAVRARRHPKIAAAITEALRSWTAALHDFYASAFPRAAQRDASSWATDARHAKSALQRAIDDSAALTRIDATRRPRA